MRSSRILFLLGFLLCGAKAASAQSCEGWESALNPNKEIPPVVSGASGYLFAETSPTHDQPTFSLYYENLSSAPLNAAIYRGGPDVNGPIVYDLPFSNATGPLFSGCAVPVPPLQGGGCAFNPADYSDLPYGDLYVNVGTVKYPDGEIRGQITYTLATVPTTWARIKDLSR